MLLQNNIFGSSRYVDDILIVYNNSNTDKHKFPDSFNNATPTMKFTIEKEINITINYTVQKATENFYFNIDRKPTITGTIIPSDSCHPHEHNYVAIHYMVNRMNTHHLNKSNKVFECNIIKNYIQ